MFQFGRKLRKGFIGLMAGLISSVASVVTALANSNPLSGISKPSVSSSSGPGAGMYQYLMPQIVPIFLLALGAMAVWYFVRHQHTKLVTLVITATIVLVILTEPTALGTFVSWVGGLFKQL
ncbi:hypothetical protein [Alicyclobacillus sp. SO9]|uniref:hypothetical protein n=1 Tax=Alicyclobacillus sp. SO9 TaxID=2665646 RepID=UPI0018E79969|nr:hypothetical protein [Alicyclobacillus sp. SO9]QQE79533.1 hypothetical protein GI364_03290 [Alicyclobacillus sp. SO9]